MIVGLLEKAGVISAFRMLKTLFFGVNVTDFTIYYRRWSTKRNLFMHIQIIKNFKNNFSDIKRALYFGK